MTRIALLQTTTGIDPHANAATLAEATARAAGEGAAMLFAPEMAGLLDRDRARASRHIVAEADSPYVAASQQAAARARLWLHIGSLPVLAESGRWRNRSLVIDPDGTIVGRYDKIHLFDIDLPTGESWRESSAYEAGEARAVVVPGTPVGALGLSICYDLRFPSLFLALRDAGAETIALPAAFTVPTGQAHWHCLLRARALDSGCHLIAAAQTGTHADGRSTFGHSLAVDPWGEILADAGEAAGLCFADIAASRREDVRQRMPVQAHRRAIAAG